jgi:hypothetical protein
VQQAYHFLGGHETLEQALALDRMRRHLLAAAPKGLAHAWRLGSLEGDVLSVYCDNGAVATRLRLAGPALIRLLQESGFAVRDIRFRVTLLARKSPTREKCARLSPAACEAMLQLHANIADGPLKQALGRLLRRHAGESNGNARRPR